MVCNWAIHRGAEELPPPPAGQEVSAAGDSGEGPRHLPEATVPEAAAGKGGPGEPEAGAGGEGERRGAGDQPDATPSSVWPVSAGATWRGACWGVGP